MHKSWKNHESEKNNWHFYGKPDVEAALVKSVLEDSDSRKYGTMKVKEKAIDDKERL